MTVTPEGTSEREVAPGRRDGDEQPAVVLARPRRRASALVDVAPRVRRDPSPRPRSAPLPGGLGPARQLYDVDLTSAELDPSPVPPVPPRHRSPSPPVRAFRPAIVLPPPPPPVVEEERWSREWVVQRRRQRRARLGVGVGLVLAALVAVLALLAARAPSAPSSGSTAVTVPPAPAAGTAGLSPAVQPPPTPSVTAGAVTP